MTFDIERARQAVQNNSVGSQGAVFELIKKGSGREDLRTQEIRRIFEGLNDQTKDELYHLAAQVIEKSHLPTTLSQPRTVGASKISGDLFDPETGNSLYRDGTLPSDTHTQTSRSTRYPTGTTVRVASVASHEPKVPLVTTVLPNESAKPNVLTDAVSTTPVAPDRMSELIEQVDQKTSIQAQQNSPHPDPFEVETPALSQNNKDSETDKNPLDPSRAIPVVTPSYTISPETQETHPLIEKTRSIIGDREWQGVLVFMSKSISPGSTPAQIVEKIKEIQTKYQLTPDGVIGPKTLEKLYLYEYDRVGYLGPIDAATQRISRSTGLGPVSQTTVESFLREPNKPEHLVSMRYLAYREVESGYQQTNLGSRFRKEDDYFSRQDLFRDYFYGKGIRGDGYTTTAEGAIISTGIDTNRPKTLAEFQAKHPDIKLATGNDAVYITKGDDGKYIFHYYRDNKLVFASLTSPGRDETSSPQKSQVRGYKDLPHYFVDDHTKNLPFAQQTGGPMPYAVDVKQGGYYIHTGPTDGHSRSHGCFRLPTLYAAIFFHTSRPGTPIIFDK